MKFIKIIFLSIVFHFFAPTNSYAIVKVYEIHNRAGHSIPQQKGNYLLLGVIFFALGIYPFVKGIIIQQMATNIVSTTFGVLMFGVGAVLILASLFAFGYYLFERNKRKQY